ncbi:hypothetical protein, partial [Nocardia cerradoensis]|uniref:hypothetical protein n=1 Tax=Nocardia cerradoensis TaxID=85688 RepID=UPI001CB8CAB2
MHDPDHLLDQIRTRYRKCWREWLLHPVDTRSVFSLASPSSQTIARESDAVGRWLRLWRNWSEAHSSARLRSV